MATQAEVDLVLNIAKSITPLIPTVGPLITEAIVLGGPTLEKMIAGTPITIDDLDVDDATAQAINTQLDLLHKSSR